FPNGEHEVRVHRSLIEVWQCLYQTPERDKVRWQGDRNVYRIGGATWTLLDWVQTLGAWRKFTGSEEAGSSVGPSVIQDPQNWALHRDAPAAARGPDGKAAGADVNLVAPR